MAENNNKGTSQGKPEGNTVPQWNNGPGNSVPQWNGAGNQAPAGDKAPAGKAKKPTYFANKRFYIRYKKKTWMLFLGVLFMLGGAMTLIDTILLLATGDTSAITDITSGIFGLGAGAALTIYYAHDKAKYGRYVELINVTVGRIPIQNIAYYYPASYQKVEQDLQSMINKRMLPGAYIDRNNGMLVLNENNPNVEEPVRTEPKEAPAPPKEVKQVSAPNEWAGITDSSIKIQDPDIVLRVDRINSTLSSIGAKIKEDRSLEKNHDIELFSEFYIPKIKVLLKDYQKLEALKDAGRQEKLKKDLVETLDALDAASMNLWRNLVNSDVVNISTELDALKNKLVMDGFNRSDFDEISQIKAARDKKVKLDN